MTYLTTRKIAPPNATKMYYLISSKYTSVKEMSISTHKLAIYIMGQLLMLTS